MLATVYVYYTGPCFLQSSGDVLGSAEHVGPSMSTFAQSRCRYPYFVSFSVYSFRCDESIGALMYKRRAPSNRECFVQQVCRSAGKDGKLGRKPSPSSPSATRRATIAQGLWRRALSEFSVRFPNKVQRRPDVIEAAQGAVSEAPQSPSSHAENEAGALSATGHDWFRRAPFVGAVSGTVVGHLERVLKGHRGRAKATGLSAVCRRVSQKLLVTHGPFGLSRRRTGRVGPTTTFTNKVEAFRTWEMDNSSMELINYFPFLRPRARKTK